MNRAVVLNRAILSLSAFVILATSSASFAAGGGGKAFEPKLPTAPATRYNGSTPIDLSNGLPLGNGTQGLPNEAYESWATAPLTTPGLSERTYPFTAKADFMKAMKQSQDLIEAALANWRNRSPGTNPDAAKYSDLAIETLTPKLDAFKSAMSKAKGASQSDWETAQSDTRRALIELRATYSDVHKNVR